jgi:hypothetical protein
VTSQLVAAPGGRAPGKPAPGELARAHTEDRRLRLSRTPTSRVENLITGVNGRQGGLDAPALGAVRARGQERHPESAVAGTR